MKILVTGGTGYVGRELALTLAGSGDQVNILARNPDTFGPANYPNIQVLAGDIRNMEDVQRAMKECQQVFHTAALVRFSSRNRHLFYETNVLGTKNVLDAALFQGVKKVVFTSTCAVLGTYLNEPVDENAPRVTAFHNDYEISKLMAEKLVIGYSLKGLHTVIVSLSKVFGPGMSKQSPNMLSYIKRVVDGKFIVIPGPHSLVSNFVFIEDAVKGHLLAMEKGKNGEKYIIGGENITYTGFFTLAASLSERKAHLLRAPLSLAKKVTRIREFFLRLLGKDPYVTAGAVAEMYRPKVFNSGKAIRELGYSITPLQDALSKTLHFLKNRGYKRPDVYFDYRCQ